MLRFLVWLLDEPEESEERSECSQSVIPDAGFMMAVLLPDYPCSEQCQRSTLRFLSLSSEHLSRFVSGPYRKRHRYEKRESGLLVFHLQRREGYATSVSFVIVLIRTSFYSVVFYAFQNRNENSALKESSLHKAPVSFHFSNKNLFTFRFSGIFNYIF
jgi:hypothetical protein